MVEQKRLNPNLLSDPKNSRTGEIRNTFRNFQLGQVAHRKKQGSLRIGHLHRLIFRSQKADFGRSKPLGKLPSFDRIVFPIPIYKR
jgi:hypothetical protein